MNKKKIFYLLFIFIFIFSGSFVQQNVFADEDDDATYNKQEVKRGGIILERGKYPLEAYEGVADTGAFDPVDKTVVSMGNGLFWLNKLLYQGFDAGIRNLSSKDILNDNIEKVNNVSTKLWGIFKDNYLVLFLTIGAIIFMYTFFIKANMSEALSLFLRIMLVFVVASLWIDNANFYVKTANNLSEELQGKVVSLSTFFTQDYGSINSGEEMLGTTTMMRNTYFQAVVYRPYLIMNYGTTLENGSEDTQGLLDEDENRIDKMLAVKKGSAGDKERKKIIDSEQDLGNEYIDKGGAGIYSKFGVGLISIVFTIALGIPFVILSLINLLVQVLILAIILILPISFALSLLPQFTNSGFSVLGKLATQFVYKAMISLFVVFALLVIQIIDNVFPPNGVGAYLINAFILSLGLIFMILKRNELISMATGGRVQAQDGFNSFRRSMYESTAIAGRAGRGAKNLGSFAGGVALGASRLGVSGGKKLAHGANNLVSKISDKRQLASQTSGGNTPSGASEGESIRGNGNQPNQKDNPKNQGTRGNTQGKRSGKRNLNQEQGQTNQPNFTVISSENSQDSKNNNDTKKSRKNTHEPNTSKQTTKLSDKRKLGNSEAKQQTANSSQRSDKRSIPESNRSNEPKKRSEESVKRSDKRTIYNNNPENNVVKESSSNGNSQSNRKVESKVVNSQTARNEQREKTSDQPINQSEKRNVKQTQRNEQTKQSEKRQSNREMPQKEQSTRPQSEKDKPND